METNKNVNNHPGNGSGTTDSAGKGTGGRRKRRRWPWILLVLVLLLAAVVWLAPYAVSSEAGRGWILSKVNQPGKERVEIGGMKLTWLGPCKVSGVKVYDDRERPLFSLTSAEWDRGLIHAAGVKSNFGRIQLDQPLAVVYAATEEEKKKEKEKEKKPKEETRLELPFMPSGQLTVHAGGVKMVREDGKEYPIEQIEGQFDLKTMNDIQGQLQLAVPGGKILSQINVKELMEGQRIVPEKATGTAKIQTEGAVDLKPLLEFAMAESQAGGAFTLNLDAQFGGGQMAAVISAKCQKLYMQPPSAQGIQPMDLSFDGKVESRKERLTGEGTFRSPGGDIIANVNYIPPEKPLSITGEQMTAALLKGEAIELPEFQMKLDGSLDLPKLGASVPSLLTIQPDLKLTGGRIRLDHIAVQGGKTPQAKGTLELSQLSAEKAGKAIAWEPIRADFDLSLEPGTGLRIQQAKASSAFMNFNATGTTQKMQGTFHADLNRLHEQIRSLLMASNLELAGVIDGNVNVDRADKQKMNVDLNLTGQGLRYRLDKKQMAARDVQMSYKGYVLLEQKEDVPVVGSGKILADEIVWAEQPLFARPVTLSWEDLEMQPKRGLVNAALFRLESEIATLDAKQIHYQPAPSLEVKGDYSGTADLEKCMQVLAKLKGQKEAGAIAGRFNFGGTCRTDGKVSSIDGQGTIEPLVIGRGEKAVKEPKAEFVHQVEINPSKQRIGIEKADWKSDMLTATISGAVNQYDKDCVLDLKGHYKGAWDRITALVHELAPKTKENFTLTGLSEGDFAMTGPVNRKDVQPSYRDLQFKTTAGWESGSIYGVSLGRATFYPTMENGQVQLVSAVIPSGDGKMQFDQVKVDLQQDGGQVVCRDAHWMLDAIAINPKLREGFLGRINPLFRVSQAKGVVSMQLERLNYPLDSRKVNEATGKGRLNFNSLQLQASGFLAEILRLEQLGGTETDWNVVRAEGVDFVIENGKVKYDNFKLQFTGGLELDFHGSVGLADDSMDLYVGVPLRAPLLKELGILNVLGERASLLGDMRIDIPLKGSSKAPMLNLAGVNVQEILKKSGQKILESPGSILESILNPPKPAGSTPAQPQTRTAPATTPPAAPVPQETAPAEPAAPAPAQPGASTEPGAPAAPAQPAAPAAPEAQPAPPAEEQPKTEAPKDKRSESKRKSTRKKER